MHMKKMYKEVLMFIDTCQAMSLFDGVDSPDLFLVGTSVLGQSAYSHQHDFSLNLDLNDKFTFAFYEFLRGDYNKFTEKTRLSDFPDLFNYKKISSNLEIKNTHKTRKPEDVYLQEYLPINKIESGVKYFNIDEQEI